MVLDENMPIFNKFQLQQAYSDALAIPKHRKKKFKTSTKWVSGVRKSALRGKCTSLIKVLAVPCKRHVRKPKPSARYVRKSALSAKPTSWNLMASLPKLKHVKQTKELYFEKLGRRQREATSKLLKELLENYKELHPPDGERSEKLIDGANVHIKCFQDPTECASKYICELSKKERLAFLQRMITMCQSKPPLKPQMPDRGKKKKIEEFERLDKIAVPLKKIDLSIKDPFKVKPQALVAIASERLQDLAKHKEERPPAPVYDFRGNEILPPKDWDIAARRRIVATERTMELAVPKRSKKKVVDDEKANPFMVSRAALTATCSERINQLAKPIERD